MDPLAPTVAVPEPNDTSPLEETESAVVNDTAPLVDSSTLAPDTSVREPPLPADEPATRTTAPPLADALAPTKA
jgi:hypothetical protein